MSPSLVLTDILDGAARIGATLFGELLSAVFANIGQRAIRRVARETFEHLLNLNLKFHLSRQTGALTRAIDRGTKSVQLFICLGFYFHKRSEGLRSYSKLFYSGSFQLPLKYLWFAAFWYLQYFMISILVHTDCISRRTNLAGILQP